MKLCSEDHVPIVHEEHFCPLCEALKKIEDLEDQLSDAREQINEIQTRDGYRPSSLGKT